MHDTINVMDPVTPVYMETSKLRSIVARYLTTLNVDTVLLRLRHLKLHGIFETGCQLDVQLRYWSICQQEGNFWILQSMLVLPLTLTIPNIYDIMITIREKYRKPNPIRKLYLSAVIADGEFLFSWFLGSWNMLSVWSMYYSHCLIFLWMS